MAARDGFYSRMVAWLKILLPLAALVLLSTLFLLSQSRDSGDLPFALIDLQERAREERISEPRFSGATKAGDLISFTAESARPDPVSTHLAHATSLRARIDLTSGTVVTFQSGAALLDTNADTALLSGDVLVTSSTGYSIRSGDLKTEMQRIGAETSGPVQGEGPPGQVSAGKMLLTEDPDSGDVHLLFTNGVKLLYQPGN